MHKALGYIYTQSHTDRQMDTHTVGGERERFWENHLYLLDLGLGRAASLWAAGWCMNEFKFKFKLWG